MKTRRILFCHLNERKSVNSKKIMIAAIIVTLLSLSFACDRTKISPEELNLAQRVLLTHEDVDPSELQGTVKPSRYFPFIAGVEYLSDGNYYDARNSFTNLENNFKKSKVAKFYAELAEFGTQNPNPLPEMVYNFNQHLFDKKDSEFKGLRNDDKMVKKMEEIYKSIDIRTLLRDEGARLEKWFNSKERKNPHDYLIYAIFQPDGRKRINIIEDGLKKFPDNRYLLQAMLGYLSSPFKNDSDRETFTSLLEQIEQTTRTQLMKIAMECPEGSSDKQVESWSKKVSAPLCDKQITELAELKWKSPKSNEKNLTEILIDYYNENAAEDSNKNMAMFLYTFTPHGLAPTGSMLLLDLYDRTEATAFQLTKAGEFDKALSYMDWARTIYSALNEDSPKLLIARMVQFVIAERTWNAELEINRAAYNINPGRIVELEKLNERMKPFMSFLTEYVLNGPYLFTAGWSRSMPYEKYVASRHQWVDDAFIRR